MGKNIAQITIAQINKYKTANPDDKTDYSALVAAVQKGCGHDTCPACRGTGTLSDGMECHICDGMGVTDATKVKATTTFTKVR